MSIAIWKGSLSNDYGTPGNWEFGFVPLWYDAAFFGAPTIPNLSINTNSEVDVGEWIFNPGASQYSFTVGPLDHTQLVFAGDGLLVNGNSVTITIMAGIYVGVIFVNDSTAANSVINNNGYLHFGDISSAGSATIHTFTGGATNFYDFSNGGKAQLITDTGGTVDFSFSSGPAGEHHLTVGSITGGGTYDLGANQLAIGSNGLSREVSGAVDDGGIYGGVAASLVKVGHDTLKLSGANNTYSGGTTIEQGAFEVAAIGAAGTGPISFESMGKAKATLEIDNAALSGHVFATNKIDNFGKHDFLDLPGLHFHAGATAKYHPATEVLAVRSGHGTDKLTLVSPHGTHFEAASDHHGGTEVFLVLA
jgi:autotransporter-associated beta strand protein